MSETTAAGVPKAAVALVVLGGVVWVAAGVLYSAQVVTCFSCASVVVAPGIDASGYPPDAIRTLAWDALYANVYVVTIGLLVLSIGLTAFRRGERWAWCAIAVFVAAGVLTALLDQLAWAAGTRSCSSASCRSSVCCFQRGASSLSAPAGQIRHPERDGGCRGHRDPAEQTPLMSPASSRGAQRLRPDGASTRRRSPEWTHRAASGSARTPARSSFWRGWMQ